MVFSTTNGATAEALRYYQRSKMAWVSPEWASGYPYNKVSVQMYTHLEPNG